MTPEQEIQQLKIRIKSLEDTLNRFARPDRYTFNRSIGFFFATPQMQFSDGSGRQDVVDNTGVAANLGARYKGNLGSTGYSVGDVIYYLKKLGLLKL